MRRTPVCRSHAALSKKLPRGSVYIYDQRALPAQQLHVGTRGPWAYNTGRHNLFDEDEYRALFEVAAHRFNLFPRLVETLRLVLAELGDNHVCTRIIEHALWRADQLGDDMKVECDNCGHCQDEATLTVVFPDIPDLLQRLTPGGVVPAGACPKCGAFVYLLRRQPERRTVYYCRLCGAQVRGAGRREHLEQHSPAAHALDWAEVAAEFHEEKVPRETPAEVDRGT